MERDEYAIMYRVEDRHWWYTGLRAMLDFAWDGFVPERPILLLDAGCGTGANLKHFTPRVEQACGIDLSQYALSFCKSRNIATARASAAKLPFADASFHVILSCDVLYHSNIENPLVALEELHRVLKPDGVLMLNLPAYEWLYSSHDRHIHTARRFTKRRVKRMVEEAGFECVYATYWNMLLFPAIAAARIWRKLRPRHASDLNTSEDSAFSPIAGTVLNIERALLRFAPMPFGLSVFCVARRRG